MKESAPTGYFKATQEGAKYILHLEDDFELSEDGLVQIYDTVVRKLGGNIARLHINTVLQNSYQDKTRRIYYGDVIPVSGGELTNPHNYLKKANTPDDSSLVYIYNIKLPIFFYNEDQPYYQFTNFYQTLVHYDDYKWPTAEHAFQAKKFNSEATQDDKKKQVVDGKRQNIYEYIKTLASIKDLQDYIEQPDVKNKYDKVNWDDIQDHVMYTILLHKFADFEGCLLLGTGDQILVYASPTDAYWGLGPDFKGQNRLGQILMRVRYDLRNKQPLLIKEHLNSALVKGQYLTEAQIKEYVKLY